MKAILEKWLLNPRTILAIYMLFALIASIQSIQQGDKPFVEGGMPYDQYNNYTIFKQSFYHLKEGKDLYILYPEEHWDLYKYSPSFSVVFGALAILPDGIGLSIWNLLNALFLLYAIYLLPGIALKNKSWIALICLIELLTSMQNEQSNGLMVGWIVLAFCLLEKEKYLPATLLLVATVFIKIFGIVAMAIFLFYPKKWKLDLYSTLWTIVLLGLPLIFVDLDQYKYLMESWRRMLSEDHSISLGFSVMGWLQTWFGMEGHKLWTLIAGVILFLIPLIRWQLYRDLNFRIWMLCSILIWVVIFNHKAESPTFIIAMVGVAIWFIKSEKSIMNITLFALAMIFTSLSPSDLFPAAIRRDWVIPYVLKAVPCILIWFKIIWDMMRMKPTQTDLNIVKEVL
jgi:hypothetical protein